MSKIVQRFILGQEIPSDATFLFFDQFNDKPLVYEVPLKQEKKPATKAMFQDEIIEAVIDHINSMTGSKYTAKSKATTSLIRARLNEGRSLDDFKTVIDKKCADWLTDTKMAQYLRPQTLFGTKFDSYLSQSSIEGSVVDPFTELDAIMAGASDAK
jgi:uncharacterized phage protein (TIGR02220 family)